MLTEKVVLGKIEVLEDGQIQLRQDTVIERDGVEIHRAYHREVLEPGQNVAQRPNRLKDIAGVVWTPEVIDQFRKKKRDALDKAEPTK